MIYCLFYLIQSLIIIKFPYQISYPEGFILYQSYLISKGVSIYKTINEYPYLVVNYPPIYQFLCAFFVKLFGVSFVFGRLITFVASIIITWIIYKILKEKTGREIAAISALLFVSSSYIYKNSPFFRVDMLGLCFSLLGIYLFLRKGKLLITAIFFVAALYTKPTFISAPLAVALYLLFTENKKGVAFIMYLIPLYAVIFFLINYFTQGEFYRHNFLYNMNIFIFKQLAKYYIWFLQSHSILILFSLIFLFSSVAEKKYSLYVIYFIISTVVALSVGKIGANMNYFFETIAVSCILTGLAINRLREIIRDEKTSTLLVNAALLIQLLLFIHIPFVTKPAITRSDLKNSKLLSEVVCSTDGKIISEDAGLLILNNKPVLFMPFEFTQLANQKLWDQTRFLNDIKHKDFSLIILSFDLHCKVDEERLTPAMVKAIKENYYINQTIGEYFLYYPLAR
ncbi:MAG: glycosyltransferase family 39 protein [bacterium]